MKILLKVLISLIETPEFLIKLDITEISEIFLENFFAFSQENTYIHRFFIEKSLFFLLKYLKFYDFCEKKKSQKTQKMRFLVVKCSNLSFLMKIKENRDEKIRVLSWNILYLLCSLKEISLFKSLLDSSLEIFINLKESCAIVNFSMNFIRKVVDLVIKEEKSEENSLKSEENEENSLKNEENDENLLKKHELMRIFSQKSRKFPVFFIKNP